MSLNIGLCTGQPIQHEFEVEICIVIREELTPVEALDEVRLRGILCDDRHISRRLLIDEESAVYLECIEQFVH